MMKKYKAIKPTIDEEKQQRLSLVEGKDGI